MCVHAQNTLWSTIKSRSNTLNSNLKPFCFVSRREVTIAIRIFIPLDAPLLYLESLKVSFKFIGGRTRYQRFRMTVAQNCMRALLYDIHTIRSCGMCGLRACAYSGCGASGTSMLVVWVVRRRTILDPKHKKYIRS